MHTSIRPSTLNCGADMMVYACMCPCKRTRMKDQKHACQDLFSHCHEISNTFRFLIPSVVAQTLVFMQTCIQTRKSACSHIGTKRLVHVPSVVVQTWCMSFHCLSARKQKCTPCTNMCFNRLCMDIYSFVECDRFIPTIWSVYLSASVACVRICHMCPHVSASVAYVRICHMCPHLSHVSASVACVRMCPHVSACVHICRMCPHLSHVSACVRMCPHLS